MFNISTFLQMRADLPSPCYITSDYYLSFIKVVKLKINGRKKRQSTGLSTFKKKKNFSFIHSAWQFQK